MKEKYLVSGGAGFIGANYVRMLASRADAPEITVVDALTYAGNLENISGEIERGEVRFVHADIRDVEAMWRLMSDVRPDVIVHFAAESHVDRSIDGPTPFVLTNICGSQTLLECARRLRAEEKASGQTPSLRRFVHVSTDEVYGHLAIDAPEGRGLGMELAGRLGRTEEPVAYGSEVFTESTPLDPTSPYSASKASSDMMALAYFRTFGLPVSVTRCSNNYGPYQFPEKLIPLMINNILEGKTLPIYGEGLNVRDWLPVDDHCRALDAGIARGEAGEVYNIGGFNERRNIDLVRELISTVRELVSEDARYAALSAIAPEDINDSLIRFVGDRPAHDARYAIDSTKIMDSTGWRPLTDIARGGLRETVRWYLDNRGWVEKIVNGDYRNYYSKMYSSR